MNTAERKATELYQKNLDTMSRDNKIPICKLIKLLMSQDRLYRVMWDRRDRNTMGAAHV